MKLLVAAIQMQSKPGAVNENLDRAESMLRATRDAGAELAVLPEMFNTGYGLIPDYGPSSETLEGPTLRLLRDRCRAWGISIAAGFVEREASHLYDSLAFCTPDGNVRIYRKRNLVFWERFRFRPGRGPLVVSTPWGRVGFAVCADMIYRRVWDEYRDRIDVALIAAAWPRFTCSRRQRSHWLFGQLGPMSGEIPGLVAKDLGIPVVFANQCGETRTTIPLLGTWVAEKLSDQFAGLSSISDGRHGEPVHAGVGEQILYSPITIHPPRGPKLCHSMSPSVAAVSSSGSAR